jgi:L-ascorbate metabolism protein UlaG (beta-lactamase superfamily)
MIAPKDKKLSLNEQTVAEPIVRGWYAWPHLVSPISGALHLANRQLKTLASFVEDPELHEEAVKSPELRGGPFVDLPANKVEDVKQMIDQAAQRGHQMIEFGNQIRALTATCDAARGANSLESLYQEVPEMLDGHVEFFYNDMGHPSFRLFEGLLYETPLYNEQDQSLHLYLVDHEERAFAFSTPRPTDEVLVIDKPFKHPIHDLLGRLRFEAMPPSEIAASLTAMGLPGDLLDPCLQEAPDNQTRHLPKAGSWRYFGHACVLVTCKNGLNILIDPLIPINNLGADVPRFSFHDLPEQIDYVLLTHNHADHVVIETLLALRHRIQTLLVPGSNGGICDPSLKLLLTAIGFESVLALDPLDRVIAEGVEIRALPFLGEHGDLDVASKLAWCVRDQGHTTVFAADSNNVSPKMYQHIHRIIGPVDVMFLGMECVGAPMSWVYGPLLLKPVDRRADQSRRLNGSDSARALDLINTLECKQVFIYAMGREPWLSFIMSIDDDENTEQMRQAQMFIEACRQRNIPAELLYGKSEGLVT